MTSELKNLSEVVERLTVFGGATAPQQCHDWVVSCGIAQIVPKQPQWVVPTVSYLRSVLPAKDRPDLIRKTAVRDPQYRLHLDLVIARVIQLIARSERWTRFEELSFGILRPLSQRLLSLVEWVAARTGKAPISLSEAQWSQFEDDVLPYASSRFHSWDNYLWGRARDVAELFPLLADQYLPLIDQPVHLTLSNRQARTMMLLIEAAREDDGVTFSREDLMICDELKRAGAPILQRVGSQLCSLTGNVELSVTGVPPTTTSASMHSVPLGLPTLAKRSRICSNAEETSWLKSSGPSVWKSEATLLSVCPVSETWQNAHLADAPPWALLPEGSVLTEFTLLKKTSAFEDALISLDRHPLYGLLLQFLIAEALDRELGDETLLLAPPLDQTGARAEWDTTVLYRPSTKSNTGPHSKGIGYLSLGRLDLVLEEIAHYLSLQTLPLPYFRAEYGLWSWALHLLIHLKVVVGQRDRWTLNPLLHDRLYTGTLMAKMLRDRRDTRESIHRVLSRLWQAASFEEGKSKLAKEVMA
jgi:hypothetical protein